MVSQSPPAAAAPSGPIVRLIGRLLLNPWIRRQVRNPMLRQSLAQLALQLNRPLIAADLIKGLPGSPPATLWASHPRRAEADALAAEAAAQLETGEGELAARKYRAALKICPHHRDALAGLAGYHVLHQQFEEALDCFGRALDADPTNPALLHNMAVLLYTLDRFDAARTAIDQALELAPDQARSHALLGKMLRISGELRRAAGALQRALKADPLDPDALYDYGALHYSLGRPDLGRKYLTRIRESLPDNPIGLGTLVFSEHYNPAATPQTLLRDHRQWAEAFGGLERERLTVQPLGGRPLRVGFVSGDLREHPVGWFTHAFLRHAPRRRIETFAYSDRPVLDDQARALRKTFGNRWRSIQNVPNAAVERLIRADRIDILVDLAGFTSPLRMALFTRHIAPINVAWAGYMGTTGLGTMDYLVGDRFHTPEGCEADYAEDILRLPDGNICYTPPPFMPEVGPLPALASGHVTFACFNNPAKINGDCLAVWAGILARLPGSRMVFSYRGMDAAENQARILAAFRRRGVAADRLEILAGPPPRQHLATYNRVDIALDTFPYSGGLTTCESLYMGVPVVALAGTTFASRHSLSHLSNAGYGDLAVTDTAAYETRALALAGDLGALAALRAGMRAQVAASPLCDGRRFAESLTAALEAAWESRCS